MSAVIDRAIVLWPWQLPPVADGALVPVAVANPAVESVWVKGPHGPEPRSPQDVHDAGYILGVDLVCRVIGSVAEPAPGFAAAPRAEVGDGRVVIDRFKVEDVDQSDPRLILPHDGSGQRLPSLSHLRRVRLGADGRLESIGPVVLPSTTPYEIYGKEDPSVTWLDGAPWLSYVGVSDWGVTPILARGRWTDDGWVYDRVADAQGHHDNRDIKILPVRPQGLLWRHDRVNTLPWGPKRMTWATSPDGGLSWSGSKPLMAGRFDWERRHVGSGAVPFPCEDPTGKPALASYYHGVHPEAGAVAGVYQTGLALFDAEHPERELGRLAEPVVTAWTNDAFARERLAHTPMDEAAFTARHGLFVVPRVVFTTGCVIMNDAQWLFSGVNDFAIERARLGPLASVLASGYV
jgi:predicted GH43/DUF377 family glycosyl hydrolase